MSKLILNTLKFLSQIGFILLCFSGVQVMFLSISDLVSNQNAYTDYGGLGLMHYLIREVFFLVDIALYAFLFYQIMTIFKKLDLAEPFSEEVGKFIFKISYISFGIFILKLVAYVHENILVKQGFESGMIYKYSESAQTHLLMAGILYLIGHIFKKGIALKNENDLTV